MGSRVKFIIYTCELNFTPITEEIYSPERFEFIITPILAINYELVHTSIISFLVLLKGGTIWFEVQELDRKQREMVRV